MKGKKSKTPEKSISEKVRHYKGETRSLKKEVENLRKRVSELEKIVRKMYTNPDKHKREKTEEDKRMERLKRFHPCYTDEND